MSTNFIPSIVHKLGEDLASLPGIGPKMAAKLAVYLATRGKSITHVLEKDLVDLAGVLECKTCGNLTVTEECIICQDETRDNSVVVVLETVNDLIHVERTGEYKGKYVVLGGLISPLSGVSPKDLNIDKLSNIIRNNQVKEVILGLSSTVEGEATSMFLSENVFKNLDLKVTQLARGLPSGVNVEYLDSQTLKGALTGRKEL